MLDFKDIKEKIKEVKFDSLRSDSDDAFEAVAVRDQMGVVTRCLDSLFGPAVFPSKNKLSDGINRVIAGFGGIMPGQTLYYNQEGKSVIFAMLWPWQDGVHTTLKIIKR